MSTEEMNWQDALALGQKLPFALIHSLSAVSFGHVPTELPPLEILEARFFSETEELRLFRDGDRLRAARVSESAEDETIDRRLAIENPRFGKWLYQRQAVLYDEDGQAYLSSPRLCGWEGGAEHG